VIGKMCRRTIIISAGLLTIFTIASTVAYAQWEPHPTPGVPKNGEGKPDLNGPMPRAADGKPDLSGIWDRLNPNGNTRGPEPAAPVVTSNDGPPLATFFNLGAYLKDGLPYTPWAAEVRRKRGADNAMDNPDAHCLPLGLMQLHLHPQPRKIIQTPNLIVIMYEAQGGVRQIFLDGRTLPRDGFQPWWYGYSVGRWEGDTLVVETSGFRDDVWLDVNGSPLTSSGKMTERFRRLNYGTLQIDVTVEDPKAYTQPFTVRVLQRVMLDTDLIEFVCNENEQSSQHYVR